MIPNDPLNAFTRHTHVALDGSGTGPLAGLTMAVKDVYDIAGYRTGNGNPVWLETHEAADRTASSVQRLLDAGTRMVGKTHTDELAYSLNGENMHYGTPTNPKAPGRIPGGSSSGSAIAVAAGLVTYAGERTGYGQMIEINHGNGLATRYCHNEQLLVKQGDMVRKGQEVALMGSTGRSTGPHLHFEVLKNGTQVDPLRFIGEDR